VIGDDGREYVLEITITSDPTNNVTLEQLEKELKDEQEKTQVVRNNLQEYENEEELKSQVEAKIAEERVNKTKILEMEQQLKILERSERQKEGLKKRLQALESMVYQISIGKLDAQVNSISKKTKSKNTAKEEDPSNDIYYDSEEELCS
jgi:carbonic anhydrase